jgi:hypothetical protein
VIFLFILITTYVIKVSIYLCSKFFCCLLGLPFASPPPPVQLIRISEVRMFWGPKCLNEIRYQARRLTCLWCHAWSLPTQCAEEIWSTLLRRGFYSVYNRVLVRVRHPPSLPPFAQYSGSHCPATSRHT